jgi:hypothetical protein
MSPARRRRRNDIVRVGGMDVDVGTLDGVELNSPGRRDVVVGGVVEEARLDSKYSIDDDDDDDGSSDDNDGGGGPVARNNPDGLSASGDAPSACPPGATASENCGGGGGGGDDPSASGQPSDGGGNPGKNNRGSGGMTTFESMYHLSPTTVWRLRSAYSPRTPQESHLDDVGSEILAHRHPGKADAMMRGLGVARESEERVCEGLRLIGEAIGSCERLRGSRWARRCRGGRGGGGGGMRKAGACEAVTTYSCREGGTGEEEEDDDDEDDEDDDVEAAEATFAYFCEKNVLPMLVDSLLCRPPPLTSASGDDATASNDDGRNAVAVVFNGPISPPSPSPFSGVTWTASVKSQILRTISDILLSASHPLSLAYLLSNNYVNELVMGMLPLDRDMWKEEALEEILPPYVTLLRGLVARLRDDEGGSVLPLFLCRRRRWRIRAGGDAVIAGAAGDREKDVAVEEDPPTETYLPLLTASVQVFCSPLGTKLRDGEGRLVRTTAMNVILNLARMTEPEVRSALVQGGDVGDADRGSSSSSSSSSLPMTKSKTKSLSSAPSPSPLPSMTSHPLTIEQELLFPHVCDSLK